MPLSEVSENTLLHDRHWAASNASGIILNAVCPQWGQQRRIVRARRSRAAIRSCFQDAKPIASDYVPQPLNSDLNVPYVRFIGHRDPLVPLRRHDTMASLTATGIGPKANRDAASTTKREAPPRGGTGRGRGDPNLSPTMGVRSSGWGTVTRGGRRSNMRRLRNRSESPKKADRRRASASKKTPPTVGEPPVAIDKPIGSRATHTCTGSLLRRPRD